MNPNNNSDTIHRFLRSKSTNSNIIKLKKTSIKSLIKNTPQSIPVPILIPSPPSHHNQQKQLLQPKCFITTHYIGKLENKFGMFTKELNQNYPFTPSDSQLIQKFTNSKLNSLAYTPRANIKYQEINIQDATNNGIDKFLHSMNFSFQANLNLFHSASSRNTNENNSNSNNGNQLQFIKKPNENCNNTHTHINSYHKPVIDVWNEQPKKMKPVLYAAKLYRGNKTKAKSKLKTQKKEENIEMKYCRVKAVKRRVNEGNRDDNKKIHNDCWEHKIIPPAIEKHLMFRKRNYTQSDYCNLYSLFFLNTPRDQTHYKDMSNVFKTRPIQKVNKSKCDEYM